MQGLGATRTSMDRVGYLKRVPLLANLDAGSLARLAETTCLRRYRKGQIIYYRGDPGNAMYVLLDGSVALSLVSDAGAEIVVARLRPVEHFGELSVLDGQPRCVTAVASEATQALAIYREHLLALLQRHADAALQIALSLSLRVRRTTDLLADMTFLALFTRIAKRLCESAGIMHDGSVTAADIRTHQDELAEMVGASREAVNKQLARLREMGLIQTSRGHVQILRPEQLRAIALGNVTDFTL
jgi:CRP/FNR family transcriptional regulator, cyclic AMP receptor protein